MATKIGFCIPTYNRSALLNQCLERIFSEVGYDIEVVIVDGGSTDETSLVIKSYIDNGYDIKYFKRDLRCGVDLDIIKCIELSSADFCWLFSDDDLLEVDAFDAINRIVSVNPSAAGFSLDYQAYDLHLNYKVKTVPANVNARPTKIPLVMTIDEAFINLGQHLGFISSQIVNRKLWLEVMKKYDYVRFCNSWIIIYMIGKMLQLNNCWVFIPLKAVRCRTGNDSFLADHGIYGRQIIAHVNYLEVIAELFPIKGATYTFVCINMIKVRMARSLAVIKSYNPAYLLQYRILKIYIKFYYKFSIFWFKIVPIFFIPNIFFIYLKKYYFKSLK